MTPSTAFDNSGSHLNPCLFFFVSSLPEVPYLCLNIQHLPTSTCMWDFFFNGSVTSHLSHLCSIKLEGGGHTPDSRRSETDEVNKSLPVDDD